MAHKRLIVCEVESAYSYLSVVDVSDGYVTLVKDNEPPVILKAGDQMAFTISVESVTMKMHTPSATRVKGIPHNE